MYRMSDLMAQLESLAPLSLAENWDNVGLMIGSRKAPVTKVLCALDVNEEVVEEAIQLGAECIVTHHPFFFKGIKKIDYDTSKGALIQKIISHGIQVYSMHTNLDITSGGINDFLAKGLNLKHTRLLSRTKEISYVKLAIYVPDSHKEEVREVLLQENKTQIGKYTGCTFSAKGEGTFVPRKGSKPAIGTLDTLEKVEEVKVETLIREDKVQKVIEEVKKVHPYEEMAYDLYRLEEPKAYEGIGRVGEIDPLSLQELAEKVKKFLGISTLRVVGNLEATVTKVSICSGSGSGYIKEASKCSEVYITGDVKFHEAQMALEEGLFVIDAGHYPLENIMMPVIANYIESSLKGMRAIPSTIHAEMFKTI